MVIQSCVKDIIVNNLHEDVYANIANTFYVKIEVNDDRINTTEIVSLINGSATMNSGTSNAICFDFDHTAIISYYPPRGTRIRFDIAGDGHKYGSITALFPNPSSGSTISSFRTDTNKTISSFGGTITYSLYHQMS